MTDVVQINWLFGNVCDKKCSYCPPLLRGGSLPFYSTEQIKEATDKLIDHYEQLGKTCHFTFTGGEPTLHEGFHSIVRSLHNRNCSTVIHTNGISRPIEWWRENRNYINNINLSVHLQYVTDEVFDNQILPLIEMFEDSFVQVPYLPETAEKANNMVAKIQERAKKISTKSTLFVDSPTNTQLYPYTDIPPPTGEFVRPQFKGQTCYVGVESLIINRFGQMHRSWCGIAKSLGHVLDKTLDLPVNPVICTKDYCKNAFDCTITKIA